jgi:REP element-mobilizing transposase RayT
MKGDYITFQDRREPVGYLITFRSYGTWLHGDKRGSVDRNHRRYGTPLLPTSPQREARNHSLLKQSPVLLNPRQRAAVEFSIRETCHIRECSLWTLNIRTNHVHVVISSASKPETVLTALKANATRSMRDAGCWNNNLTAHGGSKRYLWTEEELANAIAYVQCDQGMPLT